MKVLHLLNSNRFSGAENVACQIIEMFRTTSDVDMVYCSPDGEIRQTLEERNIQFVPLKKLNVKAVKQVICEQKPDIIHAHDMRASFIVALCCGKIPFISHIHNNAYESRGLSLKSIAYLLAVKKSKKIFWVSQSSFDGYIFRKLFASKSSILYNVIDIDALYKKMNQDINTYDFDVIYLGRLTKPKNPYRLLNVCSLMIEKKKNIRIAIVGTGEMENEIKQKAADMNLLDNVLFLGFQSNPLKMLHDSKCMIMTSLWEGTPMCVLEAMALGVPVVSTPTDGIKDLIINGENGYLDDDDSDIASHIIEILDDDSLHCVMSQNSMDKSLIINNKERYMNYLYKAYNCID